MAKSLIVFMLASAVSVGTAFAEKPKEFSTTGGVSRAGSGGGVSRGDMGRPSNPPSSGGGFGRGGSSGSVSRPTPPSSGGGYSGGHSGGVSRGGDMGRPSNPPSSGGGFGRGGSSGSVSRPTPPISGGGYSGGGNSGGVSRGGDMGRGGDVGRPPMPGNPGGASPGGVSRGGGDDRGRGGNVGRTPFPDRPPVTRIPDGRGVSRGGAVFHRDDRGSVVSHHHYERYDNAYRRMDTVMRHDTRIANYVMRHEPNYTGVYRFEFERAHTRYVSHYDTWRNHYRPWWEHGFCGGYRWEIRPYHDIHLYFYNPMVSWFYQDDWDDYYYQTWYGNDYVSYTTQLNYRLKNLGVFYPTEAFRDLNVDVSAMPVLYQVNYRTAMKLLINRLRQEVAARNDGISSLEKNSVVVTYYQNLPLDAGIVIEGFVNKDEIEFPFKALLDLRNPRASQFFIPKSYDFNASSVQWNELNMMNNQIKSYNGVVERGGDEIIN